MRFSKILIVEDEFTVANFWKDILETRGYSVIAIVSSGISALEKTAINRPDLILMDIKLKGDLDGITTAKMMRPQFCFPIIFITELPDENGGLFESAKETYPQSFISKPIDERTLLRAVELAIQNSKTGDIDITHDAIFIPVHGKGRTKVKVLFKDIRYIEGNGSYSEIHFESNNKQIRSSYKVTTNLSHLVQQFGCASIVRVHKSYFVNINKIDALNTYSVVVGNKEIEVSETYRDGLKNALNIVKLK